MNKNIVNSLMKSRNPLSYVPINYLLGKYFFKRFYSVNNNPFFEKPVISISFDNDHEEDYAALPPILDTLDQFQMKTSFAVIGKFITQYPDQHAEIIQRGHELINHTYSHPFNPHWNPHQKFHKLSIDEQEAEIVNCHDTAVNFLNYEMHGFRIPHFQVQFTPTIYPILKKLKYSYSSSIKANRAPKQWQPYREEGNVIELPLTTCIKHPLQTFDSYHAFRKGAHNGQKQFSGLFQEIVNVAVKNNAYINLYLDPQDFNGKNISCLEAILFIIKSSDIEYASYSEIVPKIKQILQPSDGQSLKSSMNNNESQKFNDHDLEEHIGKRFDNIADFFPSDVPAHDKRLQIIADLIKTAPGKTILDVGCGKGRFSKWMIEQNAHVTGVELSDNLLKEAQKIPKGTFVKGSATKLDFPDETFDCVVCIEVLQHIPDTKKAVSEMCRVLKKGGKLLILDRNKFSPLRAVWKKYRESRNQWMYPRDFNFKERTFSPWGLAKLLRHFCTDVKIKYLGEFIQKGGIIYTIAVHVSNGLGCLIPAASYNIAWLGTKE